PGAAAVHGDLDVVLVRAGEALAGGELGLAVALLVLADGVVDVPLRGEGVLHRRNGPVAQGNLVRAAGEVPVYGRGGFAQALDEGGPVAREPRRQAAEPLGKVVQRVEEAG